MRTWRGTNSRQRRRGTSPAEPYGDGGRGRGEHRAVKVGQVLRPEYSKKMVRVITKVFR